MMALRRLLLVCLVGAACNSTKHEPQAGSDSAASPVAPAMAAPMMAPAAPAMAPAAPAMAKTEPMLAETPANQLGTAQAGLGLDVGTKAPDGVLLDITGKQQTLAALYRQGPTFVVFYRGGWCPFCNAQLHQLTESMPEFDKRHLKLVAISVETPGEEAKTQAAHGVPFPMLSDSDLTVHKAYNVVHVPGDAELEALAGHGVDLEARSGGQHHHSFAVPSVFLVDQTGTIRWRHVDQDFTTRPSPAQLIEVAEHTLKM